MMDNINIGNSIESFEPGLASKVITGVYLLNNNGEVVGFAGNENGKVIEAVIPDGSNAMAQSILSKLEGYIYRPYNGTNALIDPAAEMGDALSVGGIYSPLIKADITFDSLYTADISAPDTDEIDDEYPYETEQQRIERKLAGAYSLITKTDSEIRLYVADEIQGISSELTLTASSLQSEISSLDGNVSTLTQTVNSFSSRISNAEGDISAIEQTINSISLTVSSNGERIGITIDGSTQYVSLTGYVTFSSLENSGETIINGDNITTGTINSDYIMLHELLTVYQSYYGSVGGYVGYTTATLDGSAGMMVGDRTLNNGLVCSTSGVKMISGSTDYQVYISQNNHVAIISGGVYTYFESNAVRPSYNDYPELGQSGGYAWGQIYSTNSSISTSDRNDKKEISYNISEYDRLFDALKPAKFKFVNGTSGRLHTGFIAQDVEEAINNSGLDSFKLAAFIKSPKISENRQIIENEYSYGLRYEEFIALCVDQIQKLKHRVEALEAK